MEDGVGVGDGSHVEEEKKRVEEGKVNEDKVEKRDHLVAGHDGSRDTEDEVFEEAVDSLGRLPEPGQTPKLLEGIGVDGNLSSDVGNENSYVGQEVEDFKEAIGTPHGPINRKEVIEDNKVESADEVNVENKIDEAATSEITGGKDQAQDGANVDAEVSNSGDELNAKSDVVVENPEKDDTMHSSLVQVGESLENVNAHSSGENGVQSLREKDLTEEGKENGNDDGNNNASEEPVDASVSTQSRNPVKEGEKLGAVDEDKEVGERKDSVVDLSSDNAIDECENIRETVNSRDTEDGDNQNGDVRNASTEEASCIEDAAVAVETGSTSSTITEENGELQGCENGLTTEDKMASQPPGSNPESGEVKKNNAAAQESDSEGEVQQSIQLNGERKIQQSSEVNKDCEIKQNTQPSRQRDVQPALLASSCASTPETRNPAATTARPAGLGRAAPLLEPAPRVVQQPHVNGTMSHTQTQQVEDTANGETDEYDETREKLQMIRVKFLRLAHRLGQTPHNVVVAQVLYRLGLAEQLRGRNGSRVGAFSFDRASAMAEQLEAAGQEPLDFSCTIMVLGKTGVGKSATINSIFDEMKFSTDAFQMGTKKVQDVEGTVQGIRVRVIDTPGLLPSWSDQRQNEKILHSVRRFIKKTPPDIVLYLDRLDMQSRDFGDMPLLRTITEIFGPSIWFNAIVVLTHAASAPPDGPNGTASSYDMFVTQRSHVIQQAIRQAAGDMRLMNPVSLVENHSACRTNRAGQRVLPNGQVWKPHLLLLSFASKILGEANALLKLQDSSIPGRPFAPRSKAPPLPFLLSSLLQSRPQVKLPDEQYGDEDEEDEFDDTSDSDSESEYDQLPPFKRLTKAQMDKLTRAQKKEYLDELEYREKLFMKKQLKEERKRRKMMKKLAAAAKELPNEYNENVEEESGGPASVPVPMSDLALPASFDSDNPTHRYRYLDSSSQWLVRPVLETHGWDHDVGYEGVNVERLFVVKEKIPISFSGQVTKDKKDANMQMEVASSIKHGEGKSTSLGFDMQNVGKDLAYTLRSEMRFNNFRRNKAAAGLSVTLLGDSLSAGVKVEDKLIAGKRFRVVLSGGAMTARGDVAYGGSLEAQLRDKEYPLGRFLTTVGLSVMDWHGDLAIGGNIQSQVPIGRSTNLIARANLNNRGAGQVSLRLNSSEQLQIALIALVPLFKKLLNYPQQMQYGQ